LCGREGDNAMPGFLGRLLNGAPLEKGIVVMIGGMLGVFLVLTLFYSLIRDLARLFPYKPGDGV